MLIFCFLYAAAAIYDIFQLFDLYIYSVAFFAGRRLRVLHRIYRRHTRGMPLLRRLQAFATSRCLRYFATPPLSQRASFRCRHDFALCRAMRVRL